MSLDNNDLFKTKRNSIMDLNETYFWTSTIKDWISILHQEKYKTIIINSLEELVKREKIKVFAFVIMPNHIHLVWKMISLNGKEMPHASFNKFTAHLFIKDLKLNHPNEISLFRVDEQERSHRIWQRDALAIKIDSLKKIEQKIDYIHYNPMQEHWRLSSTAEEYYYSSANFYENGIDDFGFLSHYREEFW